MSCCNPRKRAKQIASTEKNIRGSAFTLPLSVSIINSSGGNDSKFAIIETEPQSIIIGATEDILSAINSIELGVIDMAEISTTEGIEKEFDLSLPNGAKAFDAPAKVTVKISYPELVTKTFNVKNFSVINSPSAALAPNLRPAESRPLDVDPCPL